MGPDLEGRIELALRPGRDGGLAVRVRSTRPQLAPRLMVGRTPTEAADLAGRVFSLCGKAQRTAAELACAAAQGTESDPAGDLARVQSVLTELAQEHAWRLLVDWPEALASGEDVPRTGVAPDRAGLLALRRAAGDPIGLSKALDALLCDWIGEPPGDWLGRDLVGIRDWSAAGGTLLARLFGSLGPGPDPGATRGPLLPPLGRLGARGFSELGARALKEPQFCSSPLWQGRPAETGAVSRECDRSPVLDWIAGRGRGIGARMLARLAELARVPQRLRTGWRECIGALALGNGAGMAAVETSRGLLIHGVGLSAGRISQYGILAPTEWSFHPQGAVVEALEGLVPGPKLRLAARLTLVSLDPCVACDLEIADA